MGKIQDMRLTSEVVPVIGHLHNSILKVKEQSESKAVTSKAVVTHVSQNKGWVVIFWGLDDARVLNMMINWSRFVFICHRHRVALSNVNVLLDCCVQPENIMASLHHECLASS